MRCFARAAGWRLFWRAKWEKKVVENSWANKGVRLKLPYLWRCFRRSLCARSLIRRLGGPLARSIRHWAQFHFDMAANGHSSKRSSGARMQIKLAYSKRLLLASGSLAWPLSQPACRLLFLFLFPFLFLILARAQALYLYLCTHLIWAPILAASSARAIFRSMGVYFIFCALHSLFLSLSLSGANDKIHQFHANNTQLQTARLAARRHQYQFLAPCKIFDGQQKQQKGEFLSFLSIYSSVHSTVKISTLICIAHRLANALWLSFFAQQTQSSRAAQSFLCARLCEASLS